MSQVTQAFFSSHILSTVLKMSKVWFITGCSAGLGHELALAALQRGDRVVATARNPGKLQDLAEHGAVLAQLDVTWPDDRIKAVVDKVVADLGRLDIVVNSAGYALIGGVEECT